MPNSEKAQDSCHYSKKKLGNMGHNLEKNHRSQIRKLATNLKILSAAKEPLTEGSRQPDHLQCPRHLGVQPADRYESTAQG